MHGFMLKNCLEFKIRSLKVAIRIQFSHSLRTCCD